MRTARTIALLVLLASLTGPPLAEAAERKQINVPSGTIRRAPGSYVIGHVFNGWTVDVQGGAANGYRWGYIHNSYGGCAWVPEAAIPASGTPTSDKCGPPQNYPISYFSNGQIGSNAQGNDGAPATIDHQRAGCNGQIGAYGNTRPFLVPAQPGSFLFNTPNDLPVRWRYVTKDGQWVMVHDPRFDPVGGYPPNWYFVKRQCIRLPGDGYSSWESLGGGLGSGPDVSSWGPGRLDVFVQGTDGRLYQKVFEAGWHDWFGLGGNITSDPGAESWDANRVDVFARGPDGTLHHIFWNRCCGWSGWESLGGGLTGGPDVSSRGPGRLDVFVRGTDNKLYQKAYDSAGWHDWFPLGGNLSSDPTVVSWDSNRVDVFARGTDNTLHHIYWTQGGGWSGWESLGGYLTSSPDVASWAPGRLDVFVRGGDNALHTRVFEGGWFPWARIGGALTSSPGAVSWGPGRIDVFGRGGDGTLHHIWYPG